MNKRLINEWGAGMPKSNPYANEPKKPYSPKKPNNPWAKSEDPEEDIPVGKREKRFDPNNWKNESRNNNYKNESRNMKKLIRLTESDLHRIVKESVNRALNENEGFMDGVRGAMNGFRGGWKEGSGIRNAVRGFRQGAAGQRQQSINDNQQQLQILFEGIQGWAEEGIRAFQQGDYEEVQSLVDSIIRNAQNIKQMMQPRNVNYRNGEMENEYWGG